jgi:Antibiotic biosynthesis monooxygenase
MYAVIQQYQFDPKASEEINRQVQEGLVRVLDKAPGFVAYYWLDTGEGTGSSTSVFEDKAGAEKSVRLSAAFMRQSLASLVGQPEITPGEVRAHARLELPAGYPPLW